MAAVRRALWFAVTCCAIAGVGCGREEFPATTVADVHVRVSEGLPWDALRSLPSSAATTGDTKLRFVAVAAEQGLDFTYRNGSEGRRLMTEGTGGGCGWLDFDRDGWWDLYLGQGGIAEADSAALQPSDLLSRNQQGTLVDVSEAAGIREDRYGQGVCIGDFDNDGFDDVFVLNIGGNTLWHNQGDGTFEAVTLGADPPWTGWSISGAWADTDRDGDLDLYVCNYCEFDPHDPVICRDPQGAVVQCQPNQVAPVPDHFYENLGDGRFRECAAERGLQGPGNRAMGVVVADLLGDERPEIFVANDGTANFLFVEESPGHYTDLAPRYGCALDSNGRAQANMGIASGDYDRNGFLDLYITHFEGEWNTLYANSGDVGFHDATAETNAVTPTLPWVGFGVVWQDFDQDGRDELLVANGHIDDLGRKRVLAMPPQLFSYDGQHWQERGTAAGPYFRDVYVGRGAVEADFDNDGDFDVAIVHQNSPAELLENRSERGHWLACEFIGRQSNRRGIGARVTVIQGEQRAMQELVGGGGYGTSRQPRLIFGLGAQGAARDLEVRWPSGVRQRLNGIAVDQLLHLVEPIDSAQ